ncbi:hypothetical protein EYF80_017188 [Liparis tanakae]|uniref:Uncharacterized protein n=1 Tax=Liparis tanakae TaxID=230148 RepID=A0A4Z2I488_9TELE|nr:hypothetical protein EYF80_017188 [Liparis tanakae]
MKEEKSEKRGGKNGVSPPRSLLHVNSHHHSPVTDSPITSSASTAAQYSGRDNKVMLRLCILNYYI